LTDRIKILVTGGAGFIGSHVVVELYEAGFEPVIVDDFSNSSDTALTGISEILGYDVKCYREDCKSEAALRRIFSEEKNIAGVIHFAAFKAVGESVKEPLKYYRNNVVSMISLLHEMEKAGVKNLVFSSSCTVYGIPDALPVTEKTPVKKPFSPYGITKQIGEDILTDLVKSGNSSLKSIALRYFNPIGAHSSGKIGELPIGLPNNLVPFITQTAAGLRDKLTVFGNDYPTPDGFNIRDYIHVVDLAKAHVIAVKRLLAGKSEPLEIYNIGTGKGNSVLEVIKAFEKVSGQKLNYQIGPRRDGDVPEIYADVTKSATELGFKTETSLEDSLLSAWNWQLALVKESVSN